MTNHITLTPAYGRDYVSAIEAIKDLEANKDFLLQQVGNRWDGKPINLSQLRPGQSVTVRYNQLRMVTTYDVPKRSV